MIIEEIYLKNNHFSGVFTDEIKEIQVLKEKLKVLKTAFIKEKKNRQEFEEKLRKLTESNTILIEENHRKEKMCIDLQKESLTLNNMIFDNNLNIKEELMKKMKGLNIDESAETTEFFNKLNNLFGFSIQKPKNELFEEIKAGFFKRKKIEEENEVFLEKIKKLRVFENLSINQEKILKIFSEIEKFNEQITVLSEELQVKSEEIQAFAEKSRNLMKKAEEFEEKLSISENMVISLKKNEEKFLSEKFEISTILQKETMINSQISQDLNYAQKKIHEYSDQITLMQEKIKEFDKMYQSFEAKYIGGASTELSSNILLILRRNLNKEFVIEYEFKNQNYIRKIAEISEIKPDIDGKKFSIIYQIEGGFKEFEHLESKDSLVICKAVKDLILMTRPPVLNQKSGNNGKKTGMFGDFITYFGN